MEKGIHTKDMGFNFALIHSFATLNHLAVSLEISIDKMPIDKRAKRQETIDYIKDAYFVFKHLEDLCRWYKNTHQDYERLRFENFEQRKRIKILEATVEKLTDKVKI